MKSLREAAQVVNSKKDFVAFVELLAKSLETNPQDWQNQTLTDYLEALHRWTEDMDGYFENTGQPVPTNVSWKLFAEILGAASIYE